ncbi:MAG: EpsG family protein [Alistipes indistinctus]
MGLYIAIWIALLVLATARREHRLLLWTVVVGMSLLAGLRDLSIGVDTRPYHEAFTIAQDGRMPPMEPGWGLLNIAVARLGGNFNLLLWIVSITTLGLVTRVATKDSPNPTFLTVHLLLNVCLLELVQRDAPGSWPSRSCSGDSICYTETKSGNS